MDDAAITIQGSQEPKGFGTKLAPLLSGGFFRPLARPSAPLYVDCADRLEQAGDDGGQLSHSDAIALIRDALVAHPSLKLDEDEGGQFGDLRQRAGQIFNRLLEAGWLEDRPASLDERWIVLSPRLSPLLGLLRGYAEDDLAALKDFAATVRSVCETLLAEERAGSSQTQSLRNLRQVVKELFDRATRAGQQMRAVETVILRYAQEQRISSTPNETLRRFLIEFHEGEHMVCYDTLEHGGLLPKLKQARLVAQDAWANPFCEAAVNRGDRRSTGVLMKPRPMAKLRKCWRVWSGLLLASLRSNESLMSVSPNSANFLLPAIAIRPRCAGEVLKALPVLVRTECCTSPPRTPLLTSATKSCTNAVLS